MSKSKHTEAQILVALKQVEARRKVEHVAREVSVSRHTLYGWKAKYGGMDASEAQKLRSLEDENSRCKRLVADLSLGREMLKAAIAKKRTELVDRRPDANWLRERYERASERPGCPPLRQGPLDGDPGVSTPSTKDPLDGDPGVCGSMSIAVNSFRYRSCRSDALLREELVKLARQKPRYGYRRLHALLERRGHAVNVKRVYRLYAEEGLTVRRKKRKRLVRDRALEPRLVRPNQEWAMDFIVDGLATGRMVRVLSIVDVYTRECVALEVDTGFASRRVMRVLDEVMAQPDRPAASGSDNGPEFTSRHCLAWSHEQRIELRHIQPAKPTQNAHVENFHGRLRQQCLQMNWFTNLFDARRKALRWKNGYNVERPTQQSR